MATARLDIAYSYGPLTQVRSLRTGDALRITPPDRVEGDSVIGALSGACT
jgi:hypothetical protein